MTPLFAPLILNPRIAFRRRWGAAFLSSLCVSLAAGLVGCGGQSHDPLGSTDTGNPPVIAETKLRVTAGDDGVVVSGAKGAVSAGAEIEVTNLANNESSNTVASDDGSFEVTVLGSINDDYRVEAVLNGKRTEADLGAPDPVVELDGRDFLLESSEGYEPVAGTSISIRFDEGNFNFSGGCNTHSGPYTLCDGALCVSEFGSTAIGCDQALEAQDQALAAFFASTPEVEYQPPVLTFTGAGMKFQFLDKEEANPDRPLMERVWTIDTFINGQTASNLQLMNAATIRFEDDGSFLVFDTCNNRYGTYALDGDEITLSDVSTDDAYCDTDLSAQEHIGKVMTEGTVTYVIDANRLTVKNDEFGLAATTE
jgi:heat shock protein HslJ